MGMYVRVWGIDRHTHADAYSLQAYYESAGQEFFYEDERDIASGQTSATMFARGE